MHWSKRSKYSKDWEVLIKMNKEYPKATGKRTVTIRSYRKRNLDWDNFVGGTKGILDALKRQELIVDDNPKNVEVIYEQKIVKKPEVEYTEILIS